MDGGNMLAKIVEELLKYAEINLGLNSLDKIYVRNILLHRLNIKEPYDGDIDEAKIRSYTLPDPLINELRTELQNSDIHEDINLLIAEIFGILTPRPSMVVEKFNSFKDKAQAFDYLYDLQIKNNYIQKSQVDKNIVWKATFPDNFLEISINMSKPEKKLSDIAKLVKNTSTTYPKCVLCKENLGFAGTQTQQPRGNLRFIPITLGNENWYIQYSPYVYYHEHCIVFLDKHINMTMSNEKFAKLLEFVQQFPCFFIGSNAELPIVGGSILNHEHFQGGKHLLPLMFAKDKFKVPTSKYKTTNVSYLNFFNSTFKITSKDKDEVYKIMCEIYNKWVNYSDEECSIIAKDNVQHNTITPIVRKEKDTYIAYVILRNNATSVEHPDGIFHAHQEFHNIKSENIGLIEAAGLFILPARLKRQMEGISCLLCNDAIDIDEFIKENPDYQIHKSYINELVQKYGRHNDKQSAEKYLICSINEVCKNILENTAVFKNDEDGMFHLNKFIKTLNL